MSKASQIRDHIAYFLQEQTKAYETEAVCDRLGMPSVADVSPWSSKRVYVQSRLAGVPAAQLRAKAMQALAPPPGSALVFKHSPIAEHGA
jgi:hypothetical protein